MNIISFLASPDAPSGLWSILINWFHNGIGNFGWTVLIVTILVKLVVSPLDFWTKLNSKKQTLIQQKCSPQVAKIKKKFGKDAEKVRIQTNSLYKREGLNVGTGCIISLLNLVISLTLFFTFFSSLRTNSAYQAINQFEELQSVYLETSQNYIISKNNEIAEYEITDKTSADTFIADYNKGVNINKLNTEINNLKLEIENETSEDVIASKNEEIASKEQEIANMISEEELNAGKDKEYFLNIYTNYSSLVNDSISVLSNAVIEKWNDIKASWLWVDNIWVSDATIRPFPTYSSMVSTASSGGYSEYVAENISQTNYELIANIVNNQGSRKNNGYFILAILAALITFASQFIMEKTSTKLGNKKADALAKQSMDGSMETSMKIMKFILPIMNVIFVLQSSASFGIYILASNIMAIAMGQITNLIINKITKKQRLEVEEILAKQAEKLIKQGKLQEKN